MTAVISAADAAEYFTLHAAAAVAKKRLDELKGKLLPAILAGAISPPALPYLLIDRPQERPVADWKGYALKLATKVFRTKLKAEAELEKVDAAWEDKTVHSLHVVANPAFRS